MRWYRARTSADPGWGPLLAREAGRWREALQSARDGPPVLLATSLGGYWAGTTLESLLAELRAAGLERSRIFSWERSAERMLNVLDKVLEP